MARLTVNEAGTSSYTDQIDVKPSDFTVAAGNTTTTISIPVAAGDVCVGAAVKVTTAFAGIGSATLDVGSDSGSGVNDIDGLIDALAINSTGAVANSGDQLDGTTKDRAVFTGSGNIVITGTPGSGAMADATAGELKVLLDIKRLDA
tara:strand:- start:2306 stop:2746 length:441 start_codon:yes stop_codon:yes gene_type:complete